jgi:hypothetical protein
VDAATGIITTIAGGLSGGFAGDGGPATAALLNLPIGLALDSAGNLFIADSGNNRVRRIDAGGVSLRWQAMERRLLREMADRPI